jgi:hypothetical protein
MARPRDPSEAMEFGRFRVAVGAVALENVPPRREGTSVKHSAYLAGRGADADSCPRFVGPAVSHSTIE